MRTIGLLLLLLAQDPPLHMPPQSGGEDNGRDLKIINANIDLLSDQDDKVRKCAQDYLLSKGMKVIPFLEQRLRERKTYDLYEMIRTIEIKSVPDFQVPANVDPALAKFAELASKVRPPERHSIDQVLLLKLSEAYAMIARGQLDAAEKMLIAIRTLDSGWKYNDWVIELHRYVQMKILETKFMKPLAEPKAAVVTVGEPIEITLRLHNIHKAPLAVTKYELAKPLVLAEVRATALEFDGTAEETQDTKTFELPEKISIEPGESWENVIRIETKDFHPDKNLYREYAIAMITTPVQFESAEEKGIRKIAFPPVKVKVIPAKYAAYIPDPLKSLTDLLGDKGVADSIEVQDISMCVLLCKGDSDSVRRANELILPFLEKANNSGGFTAVIRLLEELNEIRLERTKEAWQRWWKESQAKPKK